MQERVFFVLFPHNLNIFTLQSTKKSNNILKNKNENQIEKRKTRSW